MVKTTPCDWRVFWAITCLAAKSPYTRFVGLSASRGYCCAEWPFADRTLDVARMGCQRQGRLRHQAECRGHLRNTGSPDDEVADCLKALSIETLARTWADGHATVRSSDGVAVGGAEAPPHGMEAIDGVKISLSGRARLRLAKLMGEMTLLEAHRPQPTCRPAVRPAAAAERR